MGVAPSAAALAALDQALSRTRRTTPKSSKIAAAFALALSLGIIGPITVYVVTKDPPMSAAESVILRALVDYAADKTGLGEDDVWRELHLHGSLDRTSSSTTRDQWSGAVKYLVARIGLD